jgi:hypothetical protein
LTNIRYAYIVFPSVGVKQTHQTKEKMSNSTKFKVVGISNNIAKLQRVGGGFTALADDANYIGKVGDIVEVLEKDYTPEGDLSGYQAMSDRYDASSKDVLLNDGTRVSAKRNRDGDIVTADGKSLVPESWTAGDTAGYNVADYFSKDSRYFGEYLGADEFGIEPIFARV